ncbi:hypothetical protein Tco_1154149 [Tanacetum coccineum]
MNTQSSSNQISLHLPNPDKSLQFRRVEESESDNLFLDHIQGEDEKAEDIQMADHLRPMEELLRIPILVIEDAINFSKCLMMCGGTSTQIDSITAFTKQVETLEYHCASMKETYDQNQEATFQLIQNQMGQMVEDLQKRPLGVLPSNTVTDPLAELNVITSMDGLTLDGSFIPNSNFLVYQENEQEQETIMEVVEIASSKSAPLVPPLETPPLSTPKPKENLKPNPHQPLIPYPSQLKEEKFQALKNPTGRADHFVYRFDIVDSLCHKFPIENNSMSGNPTHSSDYVVESPSPSPIPYEDSDSLVEETDTLLSHFNDSSPDYETFCFDTEEKSSGSTTTHSDYPLSDYDAFSFCNTPKYG